MILIPDPKHGDIIKKNYTMYPTYMIAIEESYQMMTEDSNAYGFCTHGSFNITTEKKKWMVQAGDFFSLQTKMSVEPIGDERNLMFAIVRVGFRGIDMVGTSEDHGRLSYIDGCTDSLLVCPPRLGDPCLNYLHFPVGIDQTQHLHPSIRMGIVIGGKGEAFQKPDGKREGWEKPLTKGCMFCLEEGEVHSFRTAENWMDIIAYHPDSDFGPTDTDHPMLNRTYIDHGKG